MGTEKQTYIRTDRRTDELTKSVGYLIDIYRVIQEDCVV
jgi:hypothetical protein